jgi:hypothetical protein
MFIFMYVKKGCVRNMGLVWFMPRVVIPEIWLAKILVDILLAHELTNTRRAGALRRARLPGVVAWRCVF